MFAVSSSLMFAHLGAYVLIPILMGIVATWLISGNRLRGWLFYLVSWFVGVGVVGYGFFLLQFVRYGIDRVAYLLLFVLLVVLLIIKLIATKTTFRDLIKTLAISLRISYWKDASRKQRVISIVLGVFLITFLVTAFYFVTHLPSYGDDAFGNWHLPVINMIYDGGVHIFGDITEILARGRLGYPIMIPAMQTFVQSIVGGYNDIYINIFPWLSVVFFLALIAVYIYSKKKSLIAALVGPALIISLPLIFIHTTQGYMDLLSAIYATLAILAFYEWLQKHGNSADFMLGLTFLSILSYVKNDGFVVYMTGILGALILYCIIHWKHVKEKIQLFRTPTSWLYIIAIILFFIAPFTFIKSYYGLGFNQAAGADAGLGLASSIHWEIFPAIRKTIWTMNNYSIAPVLFIVVMLWMLIRRKHIRREQLFLALSPLAILGIFLLVFLLTENYKFVLDQTTVNRVFTMVLVIFFSSFGLLLNQPKE